MEDATIILVFRTHRENIGPQVTDAIADRLRERTNKHSLVKWRIVTPFEERGSIDLYLRGVCRHVHVTKRAGGG